MVRMGVGHKESPHLRQVAAAFPDLLRQRRVAIVRVPATVHQSALTSTAYVVHQHVRKTSRDPRVRLQVLPEPVRLRPLEFGERGDELNDPFAYSLHNQPSV